MLDYRPSGPDADAKTLKLRQHFRNLALTILLGASAAANAADYGNIGFGWGIPYATLGLNIDIKVTRDFYWTESVGTGFNDTGYAIGARYYVKTLSDNTRVRLSGIYGVYSGVEYLANDTQGNPVDKKGEDFASLALGIGIQWMSGREGFDVDVLYVDTASSKSRARELRSQGYRINRVGADNVSVGIGYRHLID